MTERTQRLLWRVLAVAAIALGVATVYLFVLGKRGSGPPAAAHRLAYMMSGNYSSNLFTCDLAGANTVQVTKGEAFSAFPAYQRVNPAGSGPGLLAFVRFHWDTSRSVGAQGELLTVPPAGGDPTRISGSLQRLWFTTPSWSPDGREILFGAVEDLNGDGEMKLDEVGVYRVALAEGQPNRVATIRGEIWNLSWSPTGALALVTYEMADDTVASVLLDLDSGKSLLEGPASAACWSPDGTTVAAYLDADRLIYMLGPDGSEIGTLDPPPGRVTALAWAAWWPTDGEAGKGRLFAIVESHPNTGAGPVYVRSAQPGDEEWLLLTGEDEAVYHLVVSPEGRYVAYTLATRDPSDDMWEGDLYVREVGKPEPVQITSDYGMEGFASFIPESPKYAQP